MQTHYMIEININGRKQQGFLLSHSRSGEMAQSVNSLMLEYEHLKLDPSELKQKSIAVHICSLRAGRQRQEKLV